MIACSSLLEARQEKATRRRAERLLQTEIDFISNPAFKTLDVEGEFEIFSECNAASWEGNNNSPSLKNPRQLPAHLARLCEGDVLAADEEQALFRRMNFLKYKANVLRSQLNPETCSDQELDTIELFLDEALRARNQIFRSNMRLVVSIIKKCVTPHVTFDDLLSDGIWTLMKAVDKFDYDRGFRFSTYAYRAITNYAYRKIADQRKERSRYLQAKQEQPLEEVSEEKRPEMDEQTWLELSELLDQKIENLDQREQLIVRARYALGRSSKVQTFQKLADQLGVSKERVRQLEQRAVAKLRAMSEETRLDQIHELVG
ncbi:sigma-70 family RNA polymerase sigma factor [Gimesia fumaroli]|jgi:RNA polymerase sigma factor (sigma-70 family)|uniref:RNA polymerase sigma factor RpoD n=1 Tax=Gimesia fumaroli TaxID=2527976 RepID=A0A518IA48_9PLAN|nr:sigma-70 family RNA polymerase sigma factor [Gimesia fumaroli]QDV49997.1 RNA polymerase sigma factor RpoD [Gimesia fumaroli]